MRLTTECPRCATSFHVTPAQLDEGRGWVRCGKCQEVFSAQAPSEPGKDSIGTHLPLALRQEGLAHEENESSPRDAPLPNTEAAKERPAPKRGRADGYWLVVAVLFIVLVIQVTLNQRQRLASHFPRAAAMAQSACAGSPICNWRNLEDVLVKDTRFDALDTRHFKLSATITNRSDLNLEAPSLVIALTDSSDRVVMQQAFAAAQWSAESLTLARQSSLPLALWIAFELPPGSPPVVGYRVQPFYP